MRIKKINRNVATEPTWDVSTNIESYTLSNGCVSHNSSSQISNSTNGIEPPRNMVSAKQSKEGVFSQVTPEADSIGPMYELAWDVAKNGNFLDLVAIMQKWVDQGISANTYHVPKMYPKGKLPLIVMLRELAFCQRYGIKSLYYHNTHDDSDSESDTELDTEGCEGCKI